MEPAQQVWVRPQVSGLLRFSTPVTLLQRRLCMYTCRPLHGGGHVGALYPTRGQLTNIDYMCTLCIQLESAPQKPRCWWWMWLVLRDENECKNLSYSHQPLCVCVCVCVRVRVRVRVRVWVCCMLAPSGHHQQKKKKR